MSRFTVVEASAGTGKTYFLEHRVIDLLLGEPAATIDEILLVTFTEKATAELRARIRGKLAELVAARDTDEGARRKLREALAGFDRAAIHTIHGFCQRLLVEDAFSGRRLFDQTQVPDEAAFTEAFHQTLRAEIALDPSLCAVLTAYLDGNGRNVAKLGEMLLTCARRGAPIEPAFDPVRLVDAADRFRAAYDALTLPLDAALGRTNGTTKKALIKRFEAIRDALPEEAGGDVVLRAIAIAHAVEGCDKETLPYLDKRLGDIKGPLGGLPALAAAAGDLVAAFVPVGAIAASTFLPRILERVRASKSRRGQFDFQDMLRLVWEVLSGPRGAELAARLRKRHPWAMIDEFQDTDEVQWDIFRTVWADAEGTSLTIVGDPKQAIYSFRGADVHTYLRAKDELCRRGAEVIPLADNWRSSADLVEAVNALLDGTHGHLFTGDIRYDAPVRAASPVGAAWPDGRAPAPVQLLEIDPPEGGKLDAEPLLGTVVQAIGDEIARLLAPPEAARLQLRDRHGVLRPLLARDIYVLTRSGKQSDDVAEALRARGVPCALYQREHLFEAEEALELADLLAAIADPRDRSARLRAWTTSFFAVPLADLEALVDVPDGHPLLTLLHDWRGLGLRKQWDELFHRILEDTRWIERTLIAGGGERAVTNVLHLLELLHDDLARTPAELHELEARLRGWIRTGTIDRPDDVDIQRLETDREAVQIMTIHRSKGLEAAVVFVCGGHTVMERDEPKLFHDDEGRRRVRVGAAWGDADARIDRDVIEENQRLMYVAITRAKARLYLPVFPAFTRMGDKAAYAPLHERLLSVRAALQTDPDTRRLFEHVRVRCGSLAPPPPAEEADHLAGWTPPPAPLEAVDPAWDAIRRMRGGVVVTSYSRLKHAAARESDRDDVRGEDHSVGVGAAPDDGLPAGAATGLFLHEILEHVPFASATDEPDWQTWAARPDVKPVVERAARRHGIADEHRVRGAALVHGALVKPVQVRGAVLGRLVDAPRVAREVEFTYPLTLPDGRPAFARGFIDLLVAWDDRLWVVDYKSDAIGDPSPDAPHAHARRHYEQQSRLYAVAAARLLGLDGEDGFRRRFGGVLYWFLRSQTIVDLPVRWADIAGWTDALAHAVQLAEEEEP